MHYGNEKFLTAWLRSWVGPDRHRDAFWHYDPLHNILNIQMVYKYSDDKHDWLRLGQSFVEPLDKDQLDYALIRMHELLMRECERLERKIEAAR